MEADATVSPADASKPDLATLKRLARKVRSRHPLARGRGGSAKRRAGKVIIDSQPSKNPPQKGLTPLADALVHAGALVNDGYVVDSLTVEGQPAPVPLPLPAPSCQEDIWRNAGDINVLVYARPLHPRMLLVQLDDGSHGRCLLHPTARARFSVGKRIWVRHERKDLYVLAGRYNRWGSRV
jgi:hypothetical protein